MIPEPPANGQGPAVPSAAEPGERLIPLPASVAAKVLLLNAMIEKKVGPSRLSWRE
jgi:antitoxin HicB